MAEIAKPKPKVERHKPWARLKIPTPIIEISLGYMHQPISVPEAEALMTEIDTAISLARAHEKRTKDDRG